MNNMIATIKKLLGHAALALGLALSANAAFADVVLNVNVNTIGFGGTGYLDFQYNALGGAPLSTAAMSNLNGFDLSKFTLEGDVAATADGFLFANTAPLNAALYEGPFDRVYSFTLTFAGDAIDTLMSTFSVSAYTGSNGDITGIPGGLLDPTLLTLDWSLAPTGAPTVTPTVFDPSVSAAVVPEPSSLLMAVLGLGLLGFVRRQRT
jgi:hypothetical protein